jgi:hypothetical protein
MTQADFSVKKPLNGPNPQSVTISGTVIANFLKRSCEIRPHILVGMVLIYQAVIEG